MYPSIDGVDFLGVLTQHREGRCYLFRGLAKVYSICWDTVMGTCYEVVHDQPEALDLYTSTCARENNIEGQKMDFSSIYLINLTTKRSVE